MHVMSTNSVREPTLEFLFHCTHRG